jgi:hypothetical protein
VAVATPQAVLLTCPRCRILRKFVAIDGGTGYRCAGCEWSYTFSPVAPTGTATAGLAAGGTAITVASGGASFTAGMLLLYDTGLSTEILTVTATGTATSVPVSAAAKAHLTGATFGQLSIAPTYAGAGDQGAVIPNPTWGF